MRHPLTRLIGAVLILALAACTSSTPATSSSGEAPTATGDTAVGKDTLTVFAAASLTDAFESLSAEFESNHPGVKVLLSFGASQQLRMQIEAGAQADVYASANKAEMDGLVQADLVDPSAPHVFAQNRLVVVLPAGNPAGLKDLRDLARPGVRLVVADPAVPAGKYTLQALEALASDPSWGAAFRQAVLANIVSQEENVRAVLAKVELGEADAGFVYLSDAASSPGLIRLELPPAANPLAKYPIAMLRQSAHAALAQAFVDFVLSPRGQQVLVSYGFLAPGS